MNGKLFIFVDCSTNRYLIMNGCAWWKAKNPLYNTIKTGEIQMKGGLIYIFITFENFSLNNV